MRWWIFYLFFSVFSSIQRKRRCSSITEEGKINFFGIFCLDFRLETEKKITKENSFLLLLSFRFFLGVLCALSTLFFFFNLKKIYDIGQKRNTRFIIFFLLINTSLKFFFNAIAEWMFVLILEIYFEFLDLLI